MTAEVPVDEIAHLYEFLVRLNDLLHQPLNLGDPQQLRAFAAENYPELRRLVYETVPGWLPNEELERIQEAF